MKTDPIEPENWGMIISWFENLDYFDLFHVTPLIVWADSIGVCKSWRENVRNLLLGRQQTVCFLGCGTPDCLAILKNKFHACHQ